MRVCEFFVSLFLLFYMPIVYFLYALGQPLGALFLLIYFLYAFAYQKKLWLTNFDLIHQVRLIFKRFPFPHKVPLNFLQFWNNKKGHEINGKARQGTFDQSQPPSTPHTYTTYWTGIAFSTLQAFHAPSLPPSHKLYLTKKQHPKKDQDAWKVVTPPYTLECPQTPS